MTSVRVGPQWRTGPLADAGHRPGHQSEQFQGERAAHLDTRASSRMHQYNARI